MEIDKAFSAEALSQTHSRIQRHIHRTPVLTSQLLDKLSGTTLFFKCENFQRGGSYKLRGALNALLYLSEFQELSGVVTHSSGNFAQALSLAAQSVEIPAYIVMPENAPDVKKAAVREYGGIITYCSATIEAREAAASKITKEKGTEFIHPSNDPQVILGQGTAAKELLEDIEGLDALVAPVGGGGLLAGTALAAQFFGKKIKVYGAEPLEVDDAYRSFKSGKIEENTSVNTIADGLRTVLGSYNFPVIYNHATDIIRVTEAGIIRAMFLVWERMKIIVEPSSAVALAAVLESPEIFREQKIGIILSGGNVDLNALPF